MGLEIERKFLVKDKIVFGEIADKKSEIAQGYLSVNPDATVRVRRIDDSAVLTVKSRNRGACRREWEYAIPVEDAIEMLSLPGIKVLSKTRYYLERGGHVWEIDVFHGALEGLVLAEVELDSPDEFIDIPDFVGEEVTGDARYYNSNLMPD